MPQTTAGFVSGFHSRNVLPEEVTVGCHRDRSPTMRAGDASQLYWADGSFRRLPILGGSTNAHIKEYNRKFPVGDFIQNSPAKLTKLTDNQASTVPLRLDAQLSAAFRSTTTLPRLRSASPTGETSHTLFHSEGPSLATAERSERWTRRLSLRPEASRPRSEPEPHQVLQPVERERPTFGCAGWERPRPYVKEVTSVHNPAYAAQQ